MPSSTLLAFVCLGAIATLLATDAGQSASAKQADPPKIEPKAADLVRKMSDTLANAKAFQFDAAHTLEVITKEGEPLQFVAQSRVAVQRPNKIRSDRLGAVADATLFYDGKAITIYGKKTKFYASTQAPDSIDSAVDFGREVLGVEAPAADFVYTDVYTGLMSDVVSGRYIGNEPVGDRMCHHVAFRARETDWQLWVQDDDRALPCRYVIVSKKVKGQPRFEVTLTNWNLDPKLDDTQFTFSPPEGATKIDFLTEKAPKQGRKQP